MRLIYSFGIHLYHFSIHIASAFSPKAKKWVSGRKNLFINLEKTIAQSSNIVWFHCASLGEFEQGRPLLEAYKKTYPSDKILLTFFSPSGYEIRKNYEKADFVFYLPIDTSKNAIKFLDITQPKMVFFIKYEFWFNFIETINKKNIPSYLVSGIFRPNQLFFQYYGKWALDQLKKFTYLFVQDKASSQLLSKYGINNHNITGDTRFDRVLEVAQNTRELADIKLFCNEKFTIVSGSSWDQEDELISKFISEENYQGKIIIAPHEIDRDKIEKLQKNLKGSVELWSNRTKVDLSQYSILIIDEIGILSSIYKYANVALIGGGFGKGVHNVLEAATFGIPILVGPNYEKFKEVIDLINLGAATEISDQREFNAVLKKFIDFESIRNAKGDLAKKYVQEHSGSTQLIIKHISSEIPPVNPL